MVECTMSIWLGRIVSINGKIRIKPTQKAVAAPEYTAMSNVMD